MYEGQVVVFYKDSNEPSQQWKVGNFLTSWATLSFSRRILLSRVSWNIYLEIYLQEMEL